MQTSSPAHSFAARARPAEASAPTTAAGAEELRRVYDDLGSRLGHREKQAEVTVAFAGAGMALFLVAGALSTLILRRLP